MNASRSPVPREDGGQPDRQGAPGGYQGKLTVVDPVVLNSARKHGISDDDMLHAYRNPVRVFALDDLRMLIGPDHAARFIEIGLAIADGVEFIVHAMPARRKFLR